MAVGKADTPGDFTVDRLCYQWTRAGKRYSLRCKFRSDDNGNTWTTISDNVPGIVQNMTADNRGRVFMGVNGNGMFVGEPVGGPLPECLLLLQAPR